MIAVLIVEDEPLIAEDIKQTCLENKIEVAGIAYSLEDAITVLEEKKVDYVLLDIQLGNSNDGLEIGKRLSEEYFIPFSYITSFSDAQIVAQVKLTKPSGYLTKPFRNRDIIIQIELGLDIAARLHKPEMPNLKQINKMVTAELTQREYEMIIELCNGKSNIEIANSLFVSMNTVKTHLKNIFSKLDVKSRTELITKVFS
ncbi:MAG: DNA-binding response regulator [Flavobacterium sp.]|jgi:DNA-binding NarL/FixJ family response regulator|uniref:response regulator transcription factor n=1 Tax=Flavobacterium sp. TaxID=239 RepID=UPI002C49C07C|nr:DNA-binding response regulator [Flavobacterium sp.]MCA0348312.1 DNA-binding response regulator [Bacteroidota bacterium]HQA74945.1 DNA-binding response regulator [Flavobacterium sp.]